VADTDKEKEEKPQSEDVKQLQGLYDLMQSEGLESLELEDDQTKIRLKRPSKHAPQEAPPSHRAAHGAPRHAAPASSPSTPKPDEASHNTIVTPLAGVFYRASSPSSAPYVSAGATVEPGQTLCIVEAMKVMNEIKAETRCKIVKIVAENSRPVTAGQTLFLVEPA